MILLSTAYLGNLQYFSKLIQSGKIEVRIEVCENFQKQTYRNRAHMMTAGGVRALTVPILWRHGQKMPIRDVRIDYSEPWQREHWRTLHAAYKASPYFDHYAEKLEFFYGKGYKPDFLFDLNCRLTETLLSIMGFPKDIRFTDEYMSPQDTMNEQILDFRDCISHKPRLQRADPRFLAPRYYQVFEDRIAFESNLSILDLLFCEGPVSGELLRNSIPE